MTPRGSESPRGAGWRAGCLDVPTRAVEAGGVEDGGRLLIESKYQTIVITAKFSFETLSLDITADIHIFAA